MDSGAKGKKKKERTSKKGYSISGLNKFKRILLNANEYEINFPRRSSRDISIFHVVRSLPSLLEIMPTLLPSKSTRVLIERLDFSRHPLIELPD